MTPCLCDIADFETKKQQQLVCLPPMMLCGSSALARRMFGPNTVAKFWTLILLLLEKLWTSFRNLHTQKHTQAHEQILRLLVIICFTISEGYEETSFLNYNEL